MPDRQEQIERLVKRHRANPESKTFAPLADLLRQDGQVEEALVLLEDGLARYPEYKTAMVILGCTLMDSNRLDHARKVLVKVLDLDPQNLVALRLLAQDAYGQGIWHLAMPWLVRLAELEPQVDEWAEKLARVRQEVDGPGSESTSEPSGPEEFATMTMAEIYIEQGYLSKALAALKLIQAREPGRPDVKIRLTEVMALLTDQRSSGAADGSTGDRGPEAGPRRSRRQEMAAKRARDKEQFNAWIDGVQPEEGRPS